jgi:CheY-like chemotaxis protein
VVSPPSRSVEVLVIGSLTAGPISAAIKALGHRTLEVKNAHDALAAVVQTPFTCVVMPLDTDGLENRELIARLRLGRPGVAIVLSARPHEAGRIVSAWVHGFDAYIVDPPDETQLKETMARVIATAHARMSTPSDTPLALQLEDTRRALEDERQRVAKLRSRVKKLEGSITGLSTELRHVVRTRTQPQMAAVDVEHDDNKTNIYDESKSVQSAPPVQATGDVRPHASLEDRVSISDLNRSRIYNDDEWSESSTAAAPVHMTIEDAESNDPAFRAPIVVDPFLDDEADATDPVDVSVKRKGNAMKIGEFRDELSDLLRPPARRPTPPSTSESASSRPRARSAVTDPGKKSGSSSSKMPRPRRS